MKVTITLRKRKRCTAVLLDYRDLDGKRHQTVVGKARTPEGLRVVRQEARAKAKQVELELLEGWHTPKQGEETIDAALLEYYEHLQASNRKESTKSTYRIAIAHFRRFLKTTRATKLRDVTPKLVIRYVQSRHHMAADTIVGEVKRLHAVFQRFVKRGVMASNPFGHPDVKDVVPSPVKHERTFADDELARFLDGCLTVTQSPQAREYHDLFLFLSETGLRLVEGLQQCWCDVHLEPDGGSYLRVTPHDGWTPKSKSSIRTVPLSPRVETMLRGYLGGKDTLDPTARIWPGNWQAWHADQQFNRVLRRLGMDERNGKGQKLRVHSFRHYYATRLVRMGVDPATVRDLLGHTSIAITNRYFNVPRSELFRAVHGSFREGITKNVTDSSGLCRLPSVSIGRSQNEASSQDVANARVATT